MAECSHAFVVDEPDWCEHDCAWIIWRRCLLCGMNYDRSGFLASLREAILDRHRIKRSRLVYE